MAESRRSSPPAKPRERTNHVFVDFENVPAVDLSLIGEKGTKVTLLIGAKQHRLELRLVRQIHEHAAKVTLIEVGASGRNALDLVLAWHLGKTVERHPADAFFVVSRDKDFDPLLAHLRTQGLEVVRVDAFSLLPFLPPSSPPTRKAPVPRRSSSASTVSLPSKPTPGVIPLSASSAEKDDRLQKIIGRLQHKTKARPVRRKTLLSHINGFYGNRLSDGELEKVLRTLVEQGVLQVDPSGSVSYPPPA